VKMRLVGGASIVCPLTVDVRPAPKTPQVPASPLRYPVAEGLVARPKQKPRWGTGLSSARRPVRGGLGAGGQAHHPNVEPQSWLHRLPPWRGWACRHEHPDQGRRLTSPIRAEPDRPAASTGGPAVGFRRGEFASPVTRVMRAPPFCEMDRPSSPRSSSWMTHLGHSAELLPLSPATSFTRSTIRRRTAGRRCINDFASRSPSSLATKSSI
jgi:hypothetical protein